MTRYGNFDGMPSASIEDAMGLRLEKIRLSHNISQSELADRAGVSRSTITRLSQSGKGVSLDSFIRIMQALKLDDHLEALLPDPDIRPIERVKFQGHERKRASSKRNQPLQAHEKEWVWGDKGKAP